MTDKQWIWGLILWAFVAGIAFDRCVLRAMTDAPKITAEEVRR